MIALCLSDAEFPLRTIEIDEGLLAKLDSIYFDHYVAKPLCHDDAIPTLSWNPAS